MSHRKVHSHGSIPFSWEDKPGICKTPSSSSSLSLSSSSSSSSHIPSLPPATPSLEDMLKIPLPPCPSKSQAHPHRSNSEKGLMMRWQEDPFLVAYKEISKSDNNVKKIKKGVNNGSANSTNIVRKSKSFFWCKSSNDVKDGNFVKLPRLPSRTFTLGQELKRDFNYEAWVSYM